MRPVGGREKTAAELHAALERRYGPGKLDALVKRYAADHAKDATTDALVAEHAALFRWVDGPLVASVRSGAFFLVDEINMAEDAVLERLNSILEPGRKLMVAEKAGDDVEEVVAADSFCVFAAMNPGGDFGKRELSPALRNRFTEIWVTPFDAETDLLAIVAQRLVEKRYAPAIIRSILFTRDTFDVTVSVGNCLAFARFMNCATQLPSDLRFVHTAHLVVLDGVPPSPQKEARVAEFFASIDIVVDDPSLAHVPMPVTTETTIGIAPFVVFAAGQIRPAGAYCLDTPTAAVNLLRLLHALQLPQAILLEGSPGVGKPSMVQTLSTVLGIPLTRVNLSEHTDISDLFGTDLPLEGGHRRLLLEMLVARVTAPPCSDATFSEELTLLVAVGCGTARPPFQTGPRRSSTPAICSCSSSSSRGRSTTRRRSPRTFRRRTRSTQRLPSWERLRRDAQAMRLPRPLRSLLRFLSFEVADGPDAEDVMRDETRRSRRC